MKLKICGMRDPENIMAVADLCPDYMGFIFFRGSKRFVGENFSVPDEFPSNIKRVGVFVNESTEEILRLAKIHHLDFIQLHGNESVGHCKVLRNSEMKLIKAFALWEGFDFNAITEFEGHVDFVLFDTKGKNFGGNGIVFDWKFLEKYNQKIPFFLSGGISPDNVAWIGDLKMMSLHALDVNSGVENDMGLKDVGKIENLKKNRFANVKKN